MAKPLPVHMPCACFSPKVERATLQAVGKGLVLADPVRQMFGIYTNMNKESSIEQSDGSSVN